MELSLWCFCLEKYFTLGRTHNQLTCVPAFLEGKKWERHTCSFFCSLILLQNRDYKLFLSGRLEVESNPARWHRENVDEIGCKRMDMCTYSLMYALEMESILYRRVWKKPRDWSFCPFKLFKDINRQSIVWKTGKSSTSMVYCSEVS